MSSSKPHKLLYKIPKRDFNFLLWEQYRLHESGAVDRNAVSALIERVAAFAEGPMAASYRESDEQEACLEADGRVRTPDSYPRLLQEYREIWKSWQRAPEAPDSGDNELIQNLVVEMLVGANPSFVTYVGFSGPAQKLLQAYGSADLQSSYGPALRTLDASACLCITEKSAGSDLTLLESVATRQPDGNYWLTGHKWLISAGMHELTENIYYFVLVRTNPSQRGMMGLTCFLVPRYRLDEQGRPSIDNGIRCREVVQKMGLKGCANVHLEFGQDQTPTVAFLLGAEEGRGLQQLFMMMTPARISTGIYALGIAAAACETARRYSLARVQGRRFDQAMSTKAESALIAEHPDIERMRMDMLSVTTGCRALIARLGWCQMQLRDTEPSSAEARVASDLLDILLPIVKAYTSDQAWRVTESAIQTLGGVGYLRDYPVEQNARDCKILSIWEGTNHMQSLFLLRDKLGMCLRIGKLETFRTQVQRTLGQASSAGGFEFEIESIGMALESLVQAAEAIGRGVRGGMMNKLPEFSCEFQAGLAEIAVAWLLLESALVAQTGLAGPALDAEDVAYYRSKIAAARHFASRRLPFAAASLAIVIRGLSEAKSQVAKPLALAG